jgi:hypothetical protein
VKRRESQHNFLSNNPRHQTAARAPVSQHVFPGRGDAVTGGPLKIQILYPLVPPFLLVPSPPLPGAAVVNHGAPFIPSSCSSHTCSGTFNFAFAILFNFPSQYFSAIGLCVIFRFRRNIPPTLRNIPKLRYSECSNDLGTRLPSLQGFHLLWLEVPFQFTTMLAPHSPH